MPKLGDYLGQVLSEIARARMQADVEAVRLADLYAKDALLKLFPVPRFRVLNVKLEIPVAVRSDQVSVQNVLPTPSALNTTSSPNLSTTSSLPQPLGTSVTTRGKLKKVPSKVVKVFQSCLRKTGISQDKYPQVTEQVKSALIDRVNKFDLHGSVPVSTTYMADELANTLRKELSGKELSDIAENEREKLITEFKEATRLRLLQLQPDPAYIEVVVDTAELREIGPPEALTRIEISIAEEGMEWKQFEHQGDTSSRLCPE